MELLSLIAAFILASVLALLIKKRVVIEASAVVASVLSLIGSLAVALKVSATGVYAILPFFSVDAFGAIVMLITSFLGLATVAYSVPYLRQETAKQIIGFNRVRQYFILLNLFLAAMFLAISANNPIIAWICIEATTLSTAFLISFYNKPSVMAAAWKYLIINSTGLLLGFFGTLLYFISINSLTGDVFVSWQTLATNVLHLDPLVVKVAFIFVIVGYGTKVGFVPMHTWKPDTYSNAPVPLGALLSGALLPVAFLILLKFKVITDGAVGPAFSQNLLNIFGILSIAVSALILFVSKSYKRVLAYSSIENAGIMALGFGFGGLGVYAAALHMIYHSFVKAVMFFSSGNLLLKYQTAKISKVKGAIHVLPFTSMLFLAGFFAVTGIPPFGIFLTKMFIFSVGITTHPVLSIIAIFFMAILFIGFFRHVTSMVFGEKPADMKAGEGNIWLLIPSIVSLLILFCLSFYLPDFLHVLLNDVASHY